MYKNQLQELAQRSCFNLPSYACVREGPDHAPRFKATVNFNGEMFESPIFYSTLRQAEHAAAEVALNTIAKRGPSKVLAVRAPDETGVFKNLLQETAHRAGLNLPVYTTVRSSPWHVPIFSCTVELAGMRFTGEQAKSKKQAEKNAAMAAWSALKQRVGSGSSSSHQMNTGCHEEQEQAIVARFLVGMKSSNSHSSQHRKPAEKSNSLLSPQPCQNWAPFTPEMEIYYYMWLQEQAVKQQNHLVAPPLSVVPMPSQVFPVMHPIIQPGYHPYCLAPAQQPVAHGLGLSITTAGSSLYLMDDKSVPDQTRTGSLSVEELHEGKPIDSSKLSPLEVPDEHSFPGTSTTEPATAICERPPLKDVKQNNFVLEAKIGSSVSLEEFHAGELRQPFTSSPGSGIQLGDSRSTESLGFAAWAPAAPGAGMVNSPSVPAHRIMRIPLPKYPSRHRPDSRFMAPPAVLIRPVVPVCSAPPPRKTPGLKQEEEPSQEMSLKFGNLRF
ncbi:hypothetical protein Dimus_012260 [Dionaea muscipula]